MITVNHPNSKKCRTTGDRVDDALEDCIYSKFKARTLPKKNLKPLPEVEAFGLSNKKRLIKPQHEIFAGFVPNTPMKRSQTDEERIQQGRYNTEICSRFSTKILLGSTKISTVYRVTDNTEAPPYIIKELNPALLSKKKKQQKAVLNEYNNAKILRGHPNIVRYETYYGSGPYISFRMEYLPGGSLDQYVQEHCLYDTVNHCEKEIVWNFLRDLLLGLDFMHKRNIVHLDIKPSNILLSMRQGSSIPTLKIGDFGLSRRLDSKSIYVGYKRGDGRYLAPELLDSKTEITTAVDIFSLGVTIYEIAGDYSANEALWEEIINERITYEKVSIELKGVLGIMLCRKPEIRITAGNCLLINDKLQEISQNDDEYVEPNYCQTMSEEEIDESSSTSEEETYSSFPPPQTSSTFEPIKRKLF